MQREPTALPPTTFTICFTGTTHVRLDGIASRLKEALDSVVPELNLTRVGPPTIVVQSRESEEDFIPLSDYVPPPPNSVTTSPEPHQEPARPSPTPPSECDQFNPADVSLTRLKFIQTTLISFHCHQMKTQMNLNNNFLKNKNREKVKT
jgi:hypothetical protein